MGCVTMPKSWAALFNGPATMNRWRQRTMEVAWKSVRVAPMRLRAITIQMPMRTMDRAFTPNPALIVQAIVGIWTGMERATIHSPTWWKARLLLNWIRCLAMANWQGTAAISFIWNLKMRQTFSAPFFQTRSFTTGRNCSKSMHLKAVGIRFRRAW